eukprot:2081357-Pyramimonas_sp.AAC.1
MTAPASPDPWAPPQKAAPRARTPSLVSRSFRYLGRHGGGRGAAGTGPRRRMAPFALETFA